MCIRDRFDSSHARIRERVEAAEGLLLCTDFDGTLAPIETDPQAPEIVPENRRVLRALRDTAGVRVAVVSGRALADVRERVGIEGIAYAGNHGLELQRRDATAVHPIAAKHRGRIARIVEALKAALAGIEGAAVEDKSVTATVHYRKTPDERIRQVREAVETALERFGDGRVRRTGGKEIIELRPAVRWHKGMAVSLLAADHEGWLPIYIGDDTTDESAFRAVEDGLAIYVGSGETAAHYRVPTQEGVTACLSALAEWHADESTVREPTPIETQHT
ncbi:trehalose-phosphatase [Halalkalicoccus jeotgali]|uniref:Trehalose 6-phosphate phosphatase n=1 Tax=Halalkalicoccus jeotgali (strain DSM 18796 / CECT 7217 / JCM 14584 / KCTC 4019 / B3) TaxID=795797 RepID=L9VJT9_HALJB|nr:trehalose-phosphatase [Halalkalicoccus jeotgali]ELY37247.1 trehalose-phosphatase [Halalkalicoccus jeotgali B3]